MPIFKRYQYSDGLSEISGSYAHIGEPIYEIVKERVRSLPLQFYIKDIYEEGGLLDRETCPICSMPFDKGKKRKLVDHCGHEKCYSCVYKASPCTVCALQGPSKKLQASRTPLCPNGSRPKLITNDTTSTPTSMRKRIASAFRSSQRSPRLGRPPLRPKTVNVDSHQQLTELINPDQLKRRSDQRLIRRIKSLWSIDDDNDVCANTKPRHHGSGENFYMRLGFLLGKNNSNSTTAQKNTRGPSSNACSTSFSSLSGSSSDMNPSTNNSPVSTLTGSSDVEIRARDSTESMNSISSPGSSGLSLGANASRRHSVTMRFASYRGGQLGLRPLFFEVPQQDPDLLYVGRSWLFKEIENNIDSDLPTNRGVILTGNIGAGKTATILQMVDYSCFGRKRDESIYQDIYERPSSAYGRLTLVPVGVKAVADRVVAYHFCQSDNSVTCLIPDFVHSVAAQMCQAPQLQAYRDLLLSDPNLHSCLSLPSCIANPSLAFIKGVLEPLHTLRRLGKLTGDPILLLVDGLCEAEFHKTEDGESIGSFLNRHTVKIPPFLKLILTVRSAFEKISDHFPFHQVSLDPTSSSDISNPVIKDTVDFATFRCSHSPTIRKNVAAALGKTESGSLLQKFIHHVVALSRGSMLYLKLLLDLVERGNLVLKSGSFKVLPQSLNEIFMLLFNLKFSSVKSYEKVQPILNICLAAVNPLSLHDIYDSVNSGLIYQFLSWEEFLTRFKILNPFLIKRTDETFMLFHPALKHWLLNRRPSESTKFLCDVRQGHACIALRMSRLQWPLDPETSLELGHHIIKAHVYRNYTNTPQLASRDLMALWLAQSSGNLSEALTHIRNLYNPNAKVSRLLLLAGALPDYPTDQIKNSPLICVCAHEGHTEMVALLVEFNADINATNLHGDTAIALASSQGHTEIVRLLTQAGAFLDTTNKDKEGPLVTGAKNGHLPVVAYLLSCDWSPNVLRTHAVQALVAAAGNGHLNVTEFLLDMAEIKIDDEDSVTGETSLTMAAGSCQKDIVAYLIKSGASLSQPNMKGTSPLACAVRQGHYEVTKLLLQKDVNVNAPDSAGRTPLMIAAAEGHSGVMELLCSKGASVCHTDREGLTAVGWACLRGHVHAVQCLSEVGADLNHADKSGRTPLDLAAYHGDPVVVQFLLDRGAILEHVDINGMRPLDRAISAKNADAVQCFLRRGAKLGPATWAMATGKPNIMVMLLTKLQDDGVTLCKKGRLKEAAHRFSYALRKLPTGDQGDHSAVFFKLRFHLTLNLSRSKRKMKEPEEAIKFADAAIELKPDSYEGFYARAMAKREANRIPEALQDLTTALGLVPPHTKEVRKVLTKLRDELLSEVETFHLEEDCDPESQNIVAAQELARLKQLAASVDHLSDDSPMTSSIMTESGYGSNI